MSAVTLPTLLLPADWPAVLTGHNADVLTSRVLPEFLSRQRWYADKEGLATTVDFTDRVHVVAPVGDCTIAVIDVSREGSASQRYTLPLAIAWETNAVEPLSRLQSHVLARVRHGAQLGVLYDGTLSGELPRLILNAVAQSRDFLSVANGYLACRPTAAFETFRDIAAESWRPLGVEQSNTSLLVDDRVIVKLYRRVQVGIHPEVEIGRFLTEVAHYSNPRACLDRSS